MCGLFGFSGTTPNPITLMKVATLAETRGPHAFGFAWVKETGIQVYKRPGLMTSNLDKLTVAQSSAVIGVCRLATSGDWENNQNNQPLSIGKVALAHNGNVYNADDLFDNYRYRPTTHCDSEALLAGALTVGIQEVVQAVGGIIAALFIDHGQLKAIRRGHPLYLEPREEGVYLCSRRVSARSQLLPDNEVITL